MQTQYSIFSHVNSSQISSSHSLSNRLTPIYSASCLFGSDGPTEGNLARFFKVGMFLLWLMGVLLFPVLSQTASSTRSPNLPSSKRVILWCSWCKSPAQTTQACQQSAADSSDPSSQSSHPRSHYPKALAVIRTANVRWFCSEWAQSIFIMFPAKWSHTSQSAGEALMHALFRWDFKESSLREKREKSISVKCLMCVRLLICCFCGEPGLFPSRISLLLPLSLISFFLTHLKA